MIGTELDGRYRIEAELGAGGAGTVYRALHLERQVGVALKVLRPELASSAELRQRFAREAQALTALSHPNIVAVVDSGVASDTAYLVMELLEGETLSARLRRGALPVAEALAIMRQLLGALAFVHEQKLVHRDVKPANVFLQRDGAGIRVRLLDFGLAKFLAPEIGGPSLTRAGQVFGTPSYMAPEQIAGQTADPRTDVYAAGIVLFEMLAGRVPFQGEASDVLRRHIMEDLPVEALPPDVPPGLVQLIKTAAAKTRPGRFADAREMLDELERVAPAPPESTSPVVASRPDAFAPTLTLEKPPATKAAAQNEERPVNRDGAAATDAGGAAVATDGGGGAVAERMTVPEPLAARPSVFQRLMRFGTTVAVVVSLTGAAIAAFTIYVLVTPGREQERKVVEDALGFPSASASVAPFQPKTLHSPKAWPSPSEESALPPPSPPRAKEPLPAPPSSASAEPPAAEGTSPAGAEDAPLADTAQEPAPPLPEEPATTAKAMEARPKGPPPQNPWASTPGELLRLMARANKTRGFDKRDMRALHQYNGRHPSDPRGHILLARGYLSRRWIRDAANEYAIALKVSDLTRGDPHLLPDLIRIVEFGSDEAVHLVEEVFGKEALPAVERALEAQSRPEVKARLTHLQEELTK
ncbi:MAG TPA: protein kinase [Polyangiaceae bacterium]|nr:protein kinase [Polyangiaceae bacterium]